MRGVKWCAVAAAFVLSSACGGKDPKLMPVDSGQNPLPGERCVDSDGDGVPGTGDCAGMTQIKDCNDTDPMVYPGAAERCDGIDNTCDGKVDEGLPTATYFKDEDQDGVGSSDKVGEGCAAAPMGTVTNSGDCNDKDKLVRPGAAEQCNDIDDDCDGAKDNGLPFQNFYVDADGDSYGDKNGQPKSSCQTSEAGMVANKSDCNDASATVKPGQSETCNKLDDNCDGQIDNGITFSDYWPDVDGDGFGSAGATSESSCAPVAGKVTNNSDCNDSSPTVKPGAPETCNTTDDNCNGQIDEGQTFATYYVDMDGDGFGRAMSMGVSSCVAIAGRVTNSTDCNDSSPMVKPGATELCNAIDDNCNGTPDDGLAFENYFTDGDGDGFGAGSATLSCAPISGKVANNQDCNDANPAVKPGATEQCNNVDDNCSGSTDEGLTFQNYWPDADGDTFGNKSAAPINACSAVTGRVTNNQDCDDTRFLVKPGVAEVCNGLDDNCNLATDEGLLFTNYYPDSDGDSFGSATAAAQSACAAVPGKVTDRTDCNDGNPNIRPGAVEACNSIDDNCDGQIDNGTMTQSYYPDVDGDGFGATGSSAIQSCNPVSGRVTNNQDCNDGSNAIRPGALEVCNGQDDNCANGADEGLTFTNYYPDQDSDGFGSNSSSAQSSCSPVSGKVTNNQDCNDGSSAVKPGAAEVCNLADDNCNGTSDEGLPTNNYYLDGDGDGFGATGGAAQAACQQPPGRVGNNTDCNDANANIKPTAVEACNNVDDNCAGGVDEGNPGGGGACSTGQSGVCGPGTLTCVSGSVSCVRNVGPSAERCDNLDNDCNGTADEAFPTKNQPCTAGLGVCQNSGTNVCTADQLGVRCSVDAGSPTPAACDGADNDCDGIVDDPAITATANINTPTAWTDVEVEPYYYSAAGCQGGVTGTGTDVLAGGGMAMSAGAGGFYFQRLDTSGNPAGDPVAAASGLTYRDVDLAQAGDGFFMAGIYESSGAGYELDFYFMDAATGAKRAQLWSEFTRTGTNTLDSLRVVRGNGRRVTVIWRETGIGYRLARYEMCLNGTTWEIKGVGCAAPPTTATLLTGSAAFAAGLGADSMHIDWQASQTCVAASSLRRIAVALLTTPQNLVYYSMNEDGTGKGADVTVNTETGTFSMAEPDLSFFRTTADQFAVSFVTKDSTAPADADLNYWLTSNSGTVFFAWLALAGEAGADSIARPRISVTDTNLWFSAIRVIADPSGLKRQVMTRTTTLSGTKTPASTTVEISPTSGSCTGQPVSCRAGDKHAFTSWAAKEKVYYSASGASPVGVFASTLSCQ